MKERRNPYSGIIYRLSSEKNTEERNAYDRQKCIFIKQISYSVYNDLNSPHFPLKYKTTVSSGSTTP